MRMTGRYLMVTYLEEAVKEMVGERKWEEIG